MTKPDLTKPAFKAALAALGFVCLGPTAGDICVYIRETSRRRRPANVPVIRVRGARRRINYRATVEACRQALMTADREHAAEQAERNRRAEIAATLAPQALPRPRATLAGAAAIHQLADDCLTLKASAGHVLYKDLRAQGWTIRQIFTHAEAARGLADARENGVFV